jgi:pSer/pThr/pTyr-binding forkhead associated (FHA) protein
MNVKLIITKGPTRIRTIQLRTPETLVGRQRGCDLRIPSAEVSRRHCVLNYAGGRLTVEDLRSANGTFVNHQRVTGKQLVHPGDHLQIGPLTFQVQYPLAAPPEDSEVGLELVDDMPVTVDGPIPLVEEADSSESMDVIFDDADTMKLPEGEDFRDFLRKMDE